MLPTDCLVLLLFITYLDGEAIGHIQSYFGSRAKESAIPNVNFIEVSAFSRLKSFAQCASHFKSQHLVLFDEKIEKVYDPNLQQHREKHRLKCAAPSAKAVFDSKKSKQSEGTPQGDCAETAHAKMCPPGEQQLNSKDYTEYASSSNIDSSKGDVFVRSKYVVVTQTGDDPDAPTMSNIDFKLTGQAATHVLFLHSYGYEIEKGQNNTFKIQLRRELEYTQHTDVEVFYFNVSCWLPPKLNLIPLAEYTKELAYTRLETYRKDFRSGTVTKGC